MLIIFHMKQILTKDMTLCSKQINTPTFGSESLDSVLGQSFMED